MIHDVNNRFVHISRTLSRVVDSEGSGMAQSISSMFIGLHRERELREFKVSFMPFQQKLRNIAFVVVGSMTRHTG